MPTSFQKAVWAAINQIPCGQITTYSEIATYLGKPKATRAVGTAVAKNPDVPTTPCHRVIPKSGLIGNYSAPGGTEAKTEILQSEGIKVKNGRVLNLDQILYCF